MTEHISATALMVDIRAFTSRLQNYLGGDSIANLPNVISRFCSNVVQICRDVHGGEPGSRLYLNSTGDGALAIFLHRKDRSDSLHVLPAYLAALQMMRDLPGALEKEGIVGQHAHDYQLGIGVESGRVVYAGFQSEDNALLHLDTYLGHCVNVAARLEGLNKIFSRSCVMLGEQTLNLLAWEMLNADYPALVRQALDIGTRDGPYDARRLMDDVNKRLLVDYVVVVAT